MGDLFLLYDRWNGLIPLIGGIYATLLAYGYLPRKPKNPARLAVWQKKFGPMMRVLGPLVVLFGAFTLAGALLRDDSITEKVRELNSTAPKMIDQITRFDRAIAGPGQLITFEHTITTIRANQISVDSWAKLIPKLKKQVFNAAVRRFQERKITLRYRYLDVNGLLVGEMEISPTDPIPQ